MRIPPPSAHYCCVSASLDVRLRGQIPPLDGIRGIAILLVLLLHFRAPDLTHPLKGILGLGWTGVQLFFVLSGFLITGILLDTRGCSNYFTSFWMRRTLRIFPLYFFALAVLLVLLPAAFPVPREALPPRGDHVYYWTYLNNWIPMGEDGRLVHILGHFWSLAVEEQFYLLWPIVVWFIPPRILLRICASGCLVILAARTWAYFSAGDLGLVYRNTILRADALLYGAAGALMLRDGVWAWRLERHIRALSVLAWGASALVLAAALGTHYYRMPIMTLGMAVFSIAFLALVVQAVLTLDRNTRLHRFFCHPWLTATGRYSYGMYVWHWPAAYVMYYAYAPLGLSGFTGAVLMLAAGFSVTYALAWASYAFFESPVLALKRFFAPRWRPAQPLAFFTASVSAGTTSNRSPTMP